LKSYIRNKAIPEGCIVERYIIEECLTFGSRCLEDIETRLNRPRRSEDDKGVNHNSEFNNLSSIFLALGKYFGVAKTFSLEHLDKIQTHFYVLAQFELVDKFRK